mmetsp:Transcript_10564/g.21983  ORF Transcript_10564/g.21983 Transcript_10564/m.21983 type:complete len:84 (-) Transcript_10564:17-268(-)
MGHGGGGFRDVVGVREDERGAGDQLVGCMGVYGVGFGTVFEEKVTQCGACGRRKKGCGSELGGVVAGAHVYRILMRFFGSVVL